MPTLADPLLATRFERLSLRALRLHLRRCTRDEVLTADLLQETLLRAWDRRRLFDPRRSLEAWVYRIGLNTLASYQRRLRVELAYLERAPRPHRGPSPEEEAQRSEDLSRIEAALPRIPARQRQALRLHCERGLSRGEIARALETTPNAVSLLLFKARRSLRQRLSA